MTSVLRRSLSSLLGLNQPRRGSWVEPGDESADWETAPVASGRLSSADVRRIRVRQNCRLAVPMVRRSAVLF